MRASQWWLIGMFLIGMGSWFVSIDTGWRSFCDFSDDSQPINKADIALCVKGEVYGPFIMLLYPLGLVFFICAWIEHTAEKKGRNN